LVRDLLDACGAAGIREVIAVIADTGDPASVELHRRFGFVDAGRLTSVGYKHDRFVDTLLLQRSLA
jgi:phosphinothricin acetyltransferase